MIFDSYNKHFSILIFYIIFQKNEVYIEVPRFLEKIIQYLIPIIKSIDDCPYIIEEK